MIRKSTLEALGYVLIHSRKGLEADADKVWPEQNWSASQYNGKWGLGVITYCLNHGGCTVDYWAPSWEVLETNSSYAWLPALFGDVDKDAWTGLASRDCHPRGAWERGLYEKRLRIAMRALIAVEDLGSSDEYLVIKVRPPGGKLSELLVAAFGPTPDLDVRPQMRIEGARLDELQSAGIAVRYLMRSVGTRRGHAHIPLATASYQRARRKGK